MSGALFRAASAGEGQAASRVIAASIATLCGADHGNDPEVIRRWTGHNSAEAMERRIESELVWVAEVSGRVVAVGALDQIDASAATGKIDLNYIDPEFRFRGISSGMLNTLEAGLRDRGVTAAVLTSTTTARPFYLARGWLPSGAPRKGRWILGHPMSKVLG